MAAFDPVTLGFYDREAVKYAAASGVSSQLSSFLARLSPGAHILELGCGAGHDAQAMQWAGFRVTATDGSVGLAAEAERRVAGGVRVMRFDELDVVEGFDAVWANACLLHVPSRQLPSILRRIWLALRAGGLFFAASRRGKAAAAIVSTATTISRTKPNCAAPISRPAPGPISMSAAPSAAATTASSGHG